MESTEFLNKITNKPRDPFQKICKYRFCEKKEFNADRLNQEYCCYDHKKKENNFKAKIDRDKTKRIDFYIKKNRKILEKKYKEGKIEVTLDELESQGFIYDYHTETKKETNLNIRVQFYYEYGLVRYDKESLNNFKIWKKQ